MSARREYRPAAVALRWVAVAALALSLAAVLAPPAVARPAAVAMAVLVIATPFARVALLTLAWLRAGDRRFAAVGAGLLLLVASGIGIARLVG